MDRVLDLLLKVKSEQDGTLTFRRSCGHGICGSDAMLINGRNRLACKIRVDQLGRKRITVAPLPGLPVVKDLVVDMEGFFAQVPQRQAVPDQRQPAPERERHQSAGPAGPLSTTPPSASCARPARPRARRSGPSPGTSGRRRSSGPSLHLRLARRGGRGAAGDPGRRGRRLALPDDLQLRRRLPARHQHHPGDPRGLLGDRRAATALSATRDRTDRPDEPLGRRVGAAGRGGRSAPTEAAVRPRRVVRIGRPTPATRGPSADRPDRRRRPRQPRPGLAGAVLIDAASPGARDPTAPPLASISEYLGVQTNNVAEYTAVVRALALADELGRPRGRPAARLQADRGAAPRPLAGQGRQAPARSTPRSGASCAGFARWRATHVPRAQNKQADALCNEAIDRAQAGGPASVVRRPLGRHRAGGALDSGSQRGGRMVARRAGPPGSARGKSELLSAG